MGMTASGGRLYAPHDVGWMITRTPCALTRASPAGWPECHHDLPCRACPACGRICVLNERRLRRHRNILLNDRHRHFRKCPVRWSSANRALRATSISSRRQSVQVASFRADRRTTARSRLSVSIPLSQRTSGVALCWLSGFRRVVRGDHRCCVSENAGLLEMIEDRLALCRPASAAFGFPGY